MKKVEIYPSLISADILNLQKVIQELEPYCDGFHIDVMDNNFVPNLTWGPMFVNAIAQFSTKKLFVHLMVDDPISIINKLHLKEKSIIAFHIESLKNIEKTINGLKEKKLTPCIAIKPKTPLEEIFEFLNVVPQILLMSVEPGFSGQLFLKDSLDRLIQLNKYRKEHNVNFEIAMDGGINKTNIHELAKNGCSIFGIASAIFNEGEPVTNLEELYELAKY